MNVPAIVAIPIRVVFVSGVLVFCAIAIVLGGIGSGARWFIDAVMDR
jgi:hypothetical protein